LGNGDFFQIVQQNLEAPPILPQPGTYFTSLSLRFNSAGNEENGGSFSTVSAVTNPPSVPEPSSLLLSAMGIALLIGLARKYLPENS
jgi:hypothetical protein